MHQEQLSSWLIDHHQRSIRAALDVWTNKQAQPADVVQVIKLLKQTGFKNQHWEKLMMWNVCSHSGPAHTKRNMIRFYILRIFWLTWLNEHSLHINTIYFLCEMTKCGFPLRSVLSAVVSTWVQPHGARSDLTHPHEHLSCTPSTPENSSALCWCRHTDNCSILSSSPPLRAHLVSWLFCDSNQRRSKCLHMWTTCLQLQVVVVNFITSNTSGVDCLTNQLQCHYQENQQWQQHSIRQQWHRTTSR